MQGRKSPPPTLSGDLSYQFDNRVGAWRLLDLFGALGVPMGGVVTSAVNRQVTDIIAAQWTQAEDIICQEVSDSNPLATRGKV